MLEVSDAPWAVAVLGGDVVVVARHRLNK